MGDKSKIEWTEASWNPIRGCRRVSAGCTNCYAETLAHTRLGGPGQPYEGLTDQHGRWNGEIRFLPYKLTEPIRWTRPRRIFANSMSDLFYEGLTDEQIDQVFGVMAACAHLRGHVFQVLTKRSGRLRDYTQQDRRRQWADVAAFHITGGDQLHDAIRLGPRALPNVWLGVSVEDGRVLDRVRHLHEAVAAVRWLSCEPLIGPLGDLPLVWGDTRIGWVVLGGESGPGARPCNRSWIDDAIQQCRRQGVAVFVKQLGAHYVDGSNPCTLRSRKGSDTSEWPPELVIREYPR